MFDVRQRLYDIGNKLKKIGGENHVIIDPERNTVSVPASSSRTCYLDQSENRVYFRCAIAPRNTFEFPGDESTLVYTIPEEYRPERTHALSLYSGSSTPSDAFINGADGGIYVRPHGSGSYIGTGWGIYIAGWWDIKSGGYLTRIFSRLRRWRYV